MSDNSEQLPGIELAPRVRVPESALQWQYARSGGPGGQNVNKVNTKAALRISLADLSAVMHSQAIARLREFAGSRLTQANELLIVAETERSQEGNRQEALARLRELLIRATAIPKPRRKSKPSKAAKARRVSGKRIRGEIKAGRQGGGRNDE